MKKPYQFASLSAGLLARKGEAVPAMESFHTAPISRAAPPIAAFLPDDDELDDAQAAASNEDHPDHARDGDQPHAESDHHIDTDRLRAVAASGANTPFNGLNPFVHLRKLTQFHHADGDESRGERVSSEDLSDIEENGAEESAGENADGSLSQELSPPATSDTDNAPSAAVGAMCASPCGDAADDSPAEPADDHAARRRASVSVRLDTPDYLRLKLASAQLHRSIQDLISTALDEHLDRLGVESMRNCRCLRLAALAQDHAPPD